ncbi:hypothetical protein D3C81_1890330 [compost metagenome]
MASPSGIHISRNIVGEGDQAHSNRPMAASTEPPPITLRAGTRSSSRPTANEHIAQTSSPSENPPARNGLPRPSDWCIGSMKTVNVK